MERKRKKILLFSNILLNNNNQKFKFSIRNLIRYFGVFILIIIFTFTLNFSNPEPIEAEVIAGTLFIVVALLLVAMGVIFIDYESPNIMIQHFWDNATTNIKSLFLAGIDEETGTFTVHEDVFDFTRGYVEDLYVEGGTVHYLASSRFTSDWGESYQYNYYPSVMGTGWTAITQEIYDNAVTYTQIEFAGYSLRYDFLTEISGDDIYRFKINESWWDTYDYHLDGQYVYTDIHYTSAVYGGEVYLHRYSSGSQLYVPHGANAPSFAFFFNEGLGLMYAVVIVNRSFEGYSVRPFRVYPPLMIVGEVVSRDVDEVNVVIDGIIVLDEDFTIDSAISIPYTLSDVIGQTSTEVIAEEWADVMTIDRYIELYGALPVSIVSDFSVEIPTDGSFTWTKLSIPMVGLTDKFPFSIPFDFRDAIVGLSATAEVPILTQNLTLAGIDGGDLTLDFTPFQPLANIIKWGLLLLFNIGLILATRRLIRG